MRRGFSPFRGGYYPSSLIDYAFDFQRVASVFTGVYPGDNAYSEPVRIACCMPHYLNHTRPLDLTRWVEKFVSCCQLCELRALMGAHPSLAHFLLELDYLVVRPGRVAPHDPYPHARMFGSGPTIPNHVVGAILRGSPIMSARQYIQVIMAMGGQPPPSIELSPGTELTRTLTRASSDAYRTELLQVLSHHRASLYRSFGPTGVRPLWALSPAELALSFEHFPLSQDDVSSGLLDWDSSPPFGLEFTLPAGRLLIPENYFVGPVPDPIQPVLVHPAALKTAGFASAWLVERAERVLLLESFEVVFRTFHIRPSGAHLVRVFLAHVNQFRHPPFATPPRCPMPIPFCAYPDHPARWPMFFDPHETDLGGEAGSFENV